MEKVIAQAGRSVNHYHADNGRFADNRFFDDINRKSQIRTFCGVVWNHQNGIIEKNKKNLTTGACMILLRDIRMWPQVIEKMFWTFVMKDVSERLNSY